MLPVGTTILSPEIGHHGLQLFGLVVDLFGTGGQLFTNCSILLGDNVELLNGTINLPHPYVLFDTTI